MAEIYIIEFTNGGTISCTKNIALKDNLAAFFNAMLDVQNKSANYNALTGQIVKMTTGAAGKTVTLPAVVVGQNLVASVVKVDSGAGAVTVDTPDGKKINGSSTHTLSSQWDKNKYISDNGNDWVIW